MFISVIFNYLGIASALYLSFSFLHFLTLYLYPSKLARYNSVPLPYALITGSSDGIGYGFARVLASHGFNIVLHGRNAAKLEAKKQELLTEYPAIKVKVLVADVVELWKHEGAIEGFVKQVEGLNLRVLINNIGGVEILMFPAPRALKDTTATEVDGLIDVNLRFATQLTRALWPQLIRDGVPSLVLNIGSMAERGAPYASIYAGAKAYNMAWSKSLRMEAFGEKQDVEVLGILVGEVTGVTHRKVEPRWMTPSARKMAEAALARVGCGRDVVVGYFPHALQAVLLSYVPDQIVVRVANYLMKDLWEKQLREMKGQ